jgi:antitoxin PrlF
MATASVTSKGQITIPVKVREELGIKAGTQIAFLKNEHGDYVIKPKTGSIMNLKGMFKWNGPPVTIEEMHDGIAAHLGEEDARIKREYNAYLAERGDK